MNKNLQWMLKRYILVIQEYVSDVISKSITNGLIAGALGMSIRMLLIKKNKIQPPTLALTSKWSYLPSRGTLLTFVPLFVISYVYSRNDLYLLYTKKYFDMLDVGEQFRMGINF